MWSRGGSTTSARFAVAMGPRDSVFIPSSPRRRIRGGDRIASMRAPFYDNHPRDFLGKVPLADAIALHWVRVITPSKASR